MRKKLLVSLVAAAMAAGTISSMVYAGEDKTVLKVAVMSGYGKGLEANREFMKTYEEAHPDIEVDWQEVTVDGSQWNVYIQKLATMAAAGTFPDVFYMAIEGLEQIYENGFVQPLNPYFEDHEGVYEAALDDTYDPKILELFKDGENIYSLGNTWGNCIMHINTDMLAEAGLELPAEDWDTDTFLEYCEALTKTNDDGTKQYALMVPHQYFANDVWMFAFGASYLNDDWTEAACDSEEAIECFQFIHDLIWKYGYSPVPQPNDDDVQMMVNGQVAMITAGRWPVTGYEANGFNTVAVQYIPSFKEMANLLGVEGFFVSSTTEHYDEACDFAVWCSSADYQKEFSTYGSLAARNSVCEEILNAIDYPENAQIFNESLTKNMKPLEAPMAYSELASIYDTYYSAMMTDENADIAALCQEMAAEMNAVLQK